MARLVEEQIRQFRFYGFVSKSMLWSAISLFSFAGCSDRPYEVAPVSGVVLLDNEPLQAAIVNTQPLGSSKSSNPGPGSFAKTNDQGEFTLELVSPAEPGAVVGQHRVVIRIPEALSASDELNPRKRPAVHLPVNALDGSLRLDVPPEGRADARFELESRKKRRR